MSRSPYAVDGPAVISFSGGRTSGYMLRKILDEGLDDDVFVVFADTGKERDETYAFVDACARAWDVEVHKVMREGGFDKLIADRNYLPTPVTRMCTGDLKVKQIEKFMRGLGYNEWTMVIGLRADEPARVASKRHATDRYWDYAVPLADAGVTERDVMAFWADQPFDLELAQHEGNCDLCFLKGKRNLVKILVDRPELADWWIAQEDKVGATFRREWSFRDLLVIADALRRQRSLDIDVRVEHVYRRGRDVKRVSDDGAVQLGLELLDDDVRPCFCTE